jgi:hypothetical protein
MTDSTTERRSTDFERRFTSIDQRLNKTDAEVSKLSSSTARLEVNDEAILRELKVVVDIVNRAKPNNLVGWLGTSLSVLVIIGAFAMVVITPITEKQAIMDKESYLDHRIDLNDAFKAGRMAADIDNLQGAFGATRTN